MLREDFGMETCKKGEKQDFRWPSIGCRGRTPWTERNREIIF